PVLRLDGPDEFVPVGRKGVPNLPQRRVDGGVAGGRRLVSAHDKPSFVEFFEAGGRNRASLWTRVTAGGPPRGPKVSATAETPALAAPATTTSSACGELRTRMRPSALASARGSGRASGWSAG